MQKSLKKKKDKDLLRKGKIWQSTLWILWIKLVCRLEYSYIPWVLWTVFMRMRVSCLSYVCEYFYLCVCVFDVIP